ncbi:MAG: hypothetical protein ABWX90_00890 [Candidatus Saccharimonadales bacterium]
MAKKTEWIELAPGVRACYRNGAVEIQCFGVTNGIKVVRVDGVSLPQDYLPDGETHTEQVTRDTFFENNKGVLVNISYFAERSKEEIEAAEKNSLTEDDFDFLSSYDADTATQEETNRARAIQEKIKSQQLNRVVVSSPHLEVVNYKQDWDSERVLAMWRGEKGPRTGGEIAEMLAKIMNGEMSIDDIDDEDADDADEDNNGPVLH